MAPSACKVFLINLTARKDRLENGLFQFLSAGTPLECIQRVEAVDTRAETYETIKQKFPDMSSEALESIRVGSRQKGHNQLTRGSIGCYLSHRKAWRMIVDDSSLGENDIALVAEDDVCFASEEARGRFRVAAVDFPWLLSGELGKADIILLGSFGREINRRLGLYLYAVRKKSARKLLYAVPATPRQQIDWELNELDDKGKIELRAFRKCTATPLHAGTDVQESEPCSLPWTAAPVVANPAHKESTPSKA